MKIQNVVQYYRSYQHQPVEKGREENEEGKR